MTDRFRPATSADVPQLVDLVESAYRGERSRAGWASEADLLDGQRVDAGMLAEALADPEVEVVVLDGEDGRPVACCELRRPGPDGVAHLGMFAVSPPLQAAGVGRGVLAEAERIAGREWHARRLELSVIDVRVPLIEWYERRGYRRTGRHEPFPYGDERFGRPRRADLRFEVLAKELRAEELPGTAAAPVVEALVGVYDADHTLWGELSYWVGARLGRSHCALCDITHGTWRERADWRACREHLPAPVRTFHRDDQPPRVRAALDGTAPGVVAETSAGVVVLLGPDDLARCEGSPERLVEAVVAAAERAGLAWPAR